MADKYILSVVFFNNNWITSISTLMMNKRVFLKEKESTATFLRLAWMVLRMVIVTKKAVIHGMGTKTLTAMEMMKQSILSLSPVQMK